MKIPVALLCASLLFGPGFARGDGPVKAPRPEAVERQLAKAGGNRGELEKALDAVPADQRPGMEFLIANMPDGDLTTLTADFLTANHALAYRAKRDAPWAKAVPEDVFLNDVLPYANVDEKRDPWRQELYDLCQPMVKACKTPTEAVQALNVELFKALKLKYAPQRRAPNFSPKESMAQGTASCTGLSIVLCDACRAVGVPARLAGTPNWSDKRGNHTWVEVWDGGWHFTGACEPDPAGLDRGWFVADAAKAQKGSPEHAIYAVSFRKTPAHFPLVWARDRKTVPGEDVTDRYARADIKKPATARVSVRVVDAAKKRVAVAVTVTGGDPAATFEGTSRGESADANDFVGFDLQPLREYVVEVGAAEKRVTTGKAGESQIVEVVAPVVDSPGALAALKAALAAKPKALAELAGRDFANAALTKADAATARQLLWDAHAARIQRERAKEVADRVLTDGTLAMPFDFTTFGAKPKDGRSLWISLHGGGNTTKAVNDKQWENQKKLYAPDEGIYLAPRAPTNTWNLWHEAHIDRLFARLIEDVIVLEGVNPDRVYVLGYSAGGDGVYQLAPRLADTWAAAGMMAGHPNGVSLESLRNVPFALQVGANDAAYKRNSVAKEYGERLAKLRAADPKGYEHFVKIPEGKGHWMGGDDKVALPWMAKFSRDPVPERVVWKQTGTAHDRSYWLAVPAADAKVGALVVARRAGQTTDIETAEQVRDVIVRFDDRTADLDRPVVITHAGRELYRGTPARTVGAMLKTLAGRGDPKLIFDAEVTVRLPAGE